MVRLGRRICTFQVGLAQGESKGSRLDRSGPDRRRSRAGDVEPRFIAGGYRFESYARRADLREGQPTRVQ